MLDDIDVIINVGDGDTAHTGGYEWEDPVIAEAVKGFVYRGGGLIGVGEPAGTSVPGQVYPAGQCAGRGEGDRVHPEL